ncbi:MAG: hypothetical protein WAK48_27875 [Candidatus Acidiferrum sp.]
MPGGRGQDYGTDADQETDTVKGDEGAANALEEGQEKAGPVEPLETRGRGDARLLVGQGWTWHGRSSSILCAWEQFAGKWGKRQGREVWKLEKGELKMGLVGRHDAGVQEGLFPQKTREGAAVLVPRTPPGMTYFLW